MVVQRILTTVIVALVFAAIGAGTAVGVMLWEPWEDSEGGTEQAVPVPQPTPDEPRLTAQEAIGLVANNCQDGRISGLIGGDATASYAGDGKWNVQFEGADGSVSRWTVDESTNAVIPLGVNIVDVRCRDQSN